VARDRSAHRLSAIAAWQEIRVAGKNRFYALGRPLRKPVTTKGKSRITKDTEENKNPIMNRQDAKRIQNKITVIRRKRIPDM
jgi:hypothetical protein